MLFHIFGSLPTTGEEVLQYFKVNYNSTHGVIFLFPFFFWSVFIHGAMLSDLQKAQYFPKFA
jgi:hypothetical protein